MKNRQEEIATLAYELYLNRGCLDGYEMHDWLEAERIIAAKHVTIEAMGAGISAHIPDTLRSSPDKIAKKKSAAAAKKTDTKKSAAKTAVPKKKAAKKSDPGSAVSKRKKS